MDTSGSVPPVPSGPADRHRHRDRHGRGMRGPVAPPQVPLAVSRADTFDSLVHDSAERLRRRLPQLAGVDFGVREVPFLPRDGEGSADGVVPLGGVERASGGRPDRIVVYRRPVELRSRDKDERAQLVHEVVVEQAAELLGLAPESVDPKYGQE
ncbi:metallopeptidase family protein [Streptomyces radicis]|uniref:Metallopeptidase family protein n=1 Tax=Streptomyces radicis TaxID=1750517 RepID=A0A3A9W7P6_9ACTN|nr:metallopeptidase family protein [Streptomyces radicis]RKN08752.1 metallopeptidase family protein [Streptomyces radicis]RKN21910.1 metallopeptidase family protein [Streptomyces radicis]